MNGHLIRVPAQGFGYPSRRSLGKNSGPCADCGTKANWRSVHNLCRRCEMESIKARPPFRMDLETFNGTPPLPYIFNPF